MNKVRMDQPCNVIDRPGFIRATTGVVEAQKWGIQERICDVISLQDFDELRDCPKYYEATHHPLLTNTEIMIDFVLRHFIILLLNNYKIILFKPKITKDFRSYRFSLLLHFLSYYENIKLTSDSYKKKRDFAASHRLIQLF